MFHSKYLIVGASHAGLSALDAIRLIEPEGKVTLLCAESTPPYSPTILPYVVSGEVRAEEVFLRRSDRFERMGVRFEAGARVVSVQAGDHSVELESGEKWEYEKLLLATGAAPSIPRIEGLEGVSYHVLRTLEDAEKLRAAMSGAKEAIVLGAGLIGMHAAENMLKAGLKVRVVEALDQVLPAYFDPRGADLIERAFLEQGIEILTGERVEGVAQSGGRVELSLSSGKTLSGDLLLVSTGVKPRTEYLKGSGVEVEEGVVVDDRMRAGGVEDVWAAGDVAQARGFFGDSKRVNATVLSAVEQGRIAGMDMVGDSALQPYGGGMAVNTYTFFKHRAFSVGMGKVSESEDDFEVDQVYLPSSFCYQKLVFSGGYLVGASGINTELDPGVLYQLIRRKVNLEEEKGVFSAKPLEMGRVLMSQVWR